MIFPEELSDKSGIYRIRSLVDGRIYVGSAINFKGRFRCHASDLRLQKHHSRYLQRAWNKYGKESFVFELIELVEGETVEEVRAALIVREQYWLDMLTPYQREIGFNLSKSADSARGYVRSEKARRATGDKLRGRKQDPELVKRRMKWLETRKHGGRAAPGVNHHRGTAFKIVSPDGVLYEGTNVSHFAREHGLSGTVLRRVVTGQVNSHKGWRLAGEDKTKQRFTKYREITLVSPKGESVTRRGIQAFAREFGLKRVTVQALISGRNKSCKGWTLPGQPMPEKRIGRFRHPVTGEIFETDNFNAFAKEHGLTNTGVYALYRGQYSHHKGWTRA